MNFIVDIRSALDAYEKDPVIKALYALAPDDQQNAFKIYQCFINNIPHPSKASYRVYEKIMTALFASNKKEIISCLDQLNQANLMIRLNVAIHVFILPV